MRSETDLLLDDSSELLRVVEDRPEAGTIARVVERLRAKTFSIAIAGEFKRGKSTLTNALLGEEVVPSGVLPLTAIETKLVFGLPSVIVTHRDGSQLKIGSAEIEDYVTERGNPRNERSVERVVVSGEWSILRAGVEIIDTPGIGSVHDHNTEVATASVMDADGAVMVLSADAPLSMLELDMIHVLVRRSSPTFFVLNKADHLAPEELGDVKRFVGHLLEQEFGREVPIFAVNARGALEAQLDHDDEATDLGIEFSEFVAFLHKFIASDLQRARLRKASTELTRICLDLVESIQIERAVRAADAQTIDELATSFAGEADRQRHALADDCVLLSRDLRHLVDSVGTRLEAFAACAPSRYAAALEGVARSSSRGRLSEDLRLEVEMSVRGAFDEFRERESEHIDASWHQLTEDFRRRVRQRVHGVREAAASLFEVPLPDHDVPKLADIGEEFTYLFVYVGTITAPLGQALGRLLPSSISRRRELRGAMIDLRREFDKHAGRTRWDLSQRVDGLRIEFQRSMSAALEESIQAITQAVDRAQEWRRSSVEEQRRHVDATSELLEKAARITTLDRNERESS